MSNQNKYGKLFVISAPSGGGKTSLTNSVILRLQGLIEISKVVTYTSRPPRYNETNGKDYHFITRTEFEKKISRGYFLESTEYSGQYYGSPASIEQELKQGKSLILIADRNGAREILQLVSNPILIWIVPPSLDILKNRIKLRGTETKEQLENRISLAQHEIKAEHDDRFFKYWVTNDVFEESVEKICSIIKHELS